MNADMTVDQARQALGPAGAMLPVTFSNAVPVDIQRGAVRRLERAGYKAIWTNEVLAGKDALVQVAVLLAATERMTFGTGSGWTGPPSRPPLAAVRPDPRRQRSENARTGCRPTSPPGPETCSGRRIWS
jgi:alkanesulfonate monooxygenase SsuD/methylene tetrahydromethanopterin reductase-like flavin-dependent oxidoreductase (luciferase family)